MKRSHGFYSKHSRKLVAGKRKSVAQLLQAFSVGEKVRIQLDPRAKGGKVPLKYNGRMGQITEKQGNAYVVQFPDLNSIKRLVLANVHLKRL